MGGLPTPAASAGPETAGGFFSGCFCRSALSETLPVRDGKRLARVGRDERLLELLGERARVLTREEPDAVAPHELARDERGLLGHRG